MLPPTESNPDGYYESREINSLNNHIINEYLSGICFKRWRSQFRSLNNSDVRAFPFASIRIPTGTELSRQSTNALRHFCDKKEYCYKDPRMCTTLPVWQRLFTGDEKFIVVFREPEITISSYIRNGQRIYSPPLNFNGYELEKSYINNYTRLMNIASSNWLFLHYKQILQLHKTFELESMAGRPLDWSHINPDLVRSKRSDYSCKSNIASQVYKALCDKAGFRE